MSSKEKKGGLFRKINSPEQAVMMLGLETVKALVLSVKIFSEFNQNLRKYYYPLILRRLMASLRAAARWEIF